MRVSPRDRSKIYIDSDKAKVAGLALLAFALAFFTVTGIHLIRSKISCKDFQTQLEAQEVYNLNPNKYKILDSDHNGIACKNLLNNHAR